MTVEVCTCGPLNAPCNVHPVQDIFLISVDVIANGEVVLATNNIPIHKIPDVVKELLYRHPHVRIVIEKETT